MKTRKVESNKKKVEGFFDDDKPIGNWKIYYSTGQILSTGSFSAGKPDGQWKFFSRENQLMKEGLYKDGKEQGLWTLYMYENGKKSSIKESPPFTRACILWGPERLPHGILSFSAGSCRSSRRRNRPHKGHSSCESESNRVQGSPRF